MTEILKPFHDLEYQSTIVTEFEHHYRDVRTLIPELPESVNIYFDQSVTTPGFGSGGYAYSPEVITIGIDEPTKLEDLRSTVFHEAYHLAQKFTGFDTAGNALQFSPIDNTIYEGAASVFEREYTGSNPGYAQYLDADTMKQWVAELQQLDTSWDYEKWKFYDPETDRKWISYRSGAFIVDTALSKSTFDILDLRDMPPSQILELAQL